MEILLYGGTMKYNALTLLTRLQPFLIIWHSKEYKKSIDPFREWINAYHPRYITRLNIFSISYVEWWMMIGRPCGHVNGSDVLRRSSRSALISSFLRWRFALMEPLQLIIIAASSRSFLISIFLESSTCWMISSISSASSPFGNQAGWQRTM